MAEFKSPGEFREVMDKVFTIMSTDAEMGPKLRETISEVFEERLKLRIKKAEEQGQDASIYQA